MIRAFRADEKALFVSLADEFYHSSAVLHSIPTAHHARTFDALMAGSPYIAAWLIELDGQSAGYALLGLTWSNEAGGLTVWLDELYVRPAFQGQGLGSALLRALHAQYPDAARFRLEIEPDNEGAARLYARLGYVALPYAQMCRDAADAQA